MKYTLTTTAINNSNYGAPKGTCFSFLSLFPLGPFRGSVSKQGRNGCFFHFGSKHSLTFFRKSMTQTIRATKWRWYRPISLHLGMGGRGGAPLSFLPEPGIKKIF